MREILFTVACCMIVLGLSMAFFNSPIDYQIHLSLPHFGFLVLLQGINLFATTLPSLLSKEVAT